MLAYLPQCLVSQWIHVFVSLDDFPMIYVPVDLGPRVLALFVPNAWLDAGFMFTYLPREGVDSDPEVAVVLLHAADEPLVSGSHLLSACLARGIQELDYLGDDFSFPYSPHCFLDSGYL